MTVRRVRIAAVSYLNTIPLLYGIEHAEHLHAQLLLSSPDRCAEAFKAGEADLALLPVSALPEIQNADIVTSYCLGTTESMRTAVLYSNVPTEQIRRVWLDRRSCAFAALTRILAKKSWKIAPEWLEMENYSVMDRPAEGDAFLVIGDNTLDRQRSFVHACDLAGCWKKLTRLPFVFAVWVARKEVAPETLDALEEALTWGIEHTWEAIVQYGYEGSDFAYDYLTREIDYLFDSEKQKALKKFWEDGLKATLRVNPG